MRTTLLVTLMTILLSFVAISSLRAEEPTVPLDIVKASLANNKIAARSGDSKVTISAWGPTLYRTTVSAAVLVEVFEFKAGEKPVYVGSGSGAVITASGIILTNWHVTWPQEFVVVIFYPGPLRSYDDLTDDEIWLAKVQKVSQRQDLALLQLLGKANGSKVTNFYLTPLSLESVNNIEVGQDVFAIGHPAGLHWTYTEGVISQIRPHYHWKVGSDEFIATTIQTQTAVSFGSSGGPLINRNGKLVGIISSGYPDKPGFNFAISAHEIRNFLTQ